MKSYLVGVSPEDRLSVVESTNRKSHLVGVSNEDRLSVAEQAVVDAECCVD